MLQFTEGTCVAIKNDNPALSLTAGDKGTIWACLGNTMGKMVYMRKVKAFSVNGD